MILMILEVAPPGVFWQIFAITFGLSIFSQVFQWFTRTGLTGQSDLQVRQQALQQEMKNAKNDPDRMYKLQLEQAEIMKTISKKQLFPMLIRSAIYIGIFALIGRMYRDYESIIFGLDWYLVYFILSMLFSLILGYLRKQLRKRLYPDEEHAQSDKIRATQSNLIYNKGSTLAPQTRPEPKTHQTTSSSWKNQMESRSSNWKNRLNDD